MKKKVLVFLCILMIMLLSLSAVSIYAYSHSLGISVSRCLVSDSGNYLAISQNSPVYLSGATGKGIFGEYDTGDKIIVVHDGICESYPGQTKAYAVIKLEEGSVDDIPDEVLESLKELGWLS